MKFRAIAPLAALALSLTVFALLSGCAKPASVDPSGAWKLSSNTNSAKAFQQTLTIRRDNGHFAGTLTYQGTLKVLERAIQDVKVQGDELSFTVTIPSTTGSGPDTTRKYRGKISGDSIVEGVCDVTWAGLPYSRDWNAKRVKQQP